MGDRGLHCPQCGSRDLDFQESAGQVACYDCGTLLEESTIVSAVEFQETGDRSHLIGQFVSLARANTAYLNSSAKGRYGFVQDSREVTLGAARRAIQQVAAAMKLPTHYAENATRLYSLALQRSLTYGRRQVLVIGVLLYIICRQERSPHLLIDFSDALQVNVFSLGHCFLQLLRLLGLQLPILDPCLFIHRFSAQLCTGEQMKPINVMALRIVTRLKKDWIASGRRHEGVCAAALLVACRAHGLQTTENQILEVFRIGSSALRSRLSEFRATPAAHLTVNQFNMKSLEQDDSENDPPSFLMSKKRHLVDDDSSSESEVGSNKKSKKIDLRNTDRRKLYTDMYKELLAVTVVDTSSFTRNASCYTSSSTPSGSSVSIVTGNKNVDNLLLEATEVASCDPSMVGGWKRPETGSRVREKLLELRVLVDRGKSSRPSTDPISMHFLSDAPVTDAIIDSLISQEDFDDYILSEEEQKKRAELREHMFGSYNKGKTRKQELLAKSIQESTPSKRVENNEKQLISSSEIIENKIENVSSLNTESNLLLSKASRQGVKISLPGQLIHSSFSYDGEREYEYT